MPGTGMTYENATCDGQEHYDQWRHKNLIEPRYEDSPGNQSAAL